MNRRLIVTILNKIASCENDVRIVCGNCDYEIEFNFDAEWEKHDVKTALFVVNGKAIPQVFRGNVCQVPVIQNTRVVEIGVFAGTIDDGTLSTSTPALVGCIKGVTEYDDTIPPPEDSVYAQIVEMCEHAVEVAEKVEEELENTDFGDGAVSSVNGQTGDVVLTADDVGAISKDTYKNEYYYGDTNIEPLPITCFTYYEDDNTVYLTGLTQDAAYSIEDVVIPYEAFGKKVKIEGYEFYTLPDYTKSLILPRGLEINGGGYAFNSGTNIKKLVLPTDVSSIPYNCFNWFSSLEEVVIPDGVITIKNESFRDCYSLKRIVIPDSVIEIDTTSFTGAHSSATIVCSAGSAAEAFAKELGYNIEYTGIVIDEKPTEGSKNAVSSGGVYEAIGDIETALDAIIAIQEALIGGDSV